MCQGYSRVLFPRELKSDCWRFVDAQVHMSRAVQSAMDMVVRMLKSVRFPSLGHGDHVHCFSISSNLIQFVQTVLSKAVGNHIYHSVGDNPAVGKPVRPHRLVHVLHINSCVVEAMLRMLCFGVV